MRHPFLDTSATARRGFCASSTSVWYLANASQLPRALIPCSISWTVFTQMADLSETASACEAVFASSTCSIGATRSRFNDISPQLFRYESYLSHSDPVVLALNPFFVLEYVHYTQIKSNSKVPSVAYLSQYQRPEGEVQVRVDNA